MYVPGTDGEKMSKSKGNIINLFLPDKQLRKQIMAIQTDSTPLEEPKDTESDNVFNIYKLVASKEETAEMKKKYEAGGFGYGHAKQALYDLLITRFEKERTQYNFYMQNPDKVEEALAVGAEKARKVADDVLIRVRQKLGY